jgi:hypothetical protein
MEWTVDVWHSLTFPVGPEPDDWRRYRVLAGSPVEAKLVACQMAASSGGRTPVHSVVVDWPE